MTDDTDTNMGTDAGVCHGRRLQCNSCGERLAPSLEYESVVEHARRCGSTVSYPYYPDRVQDGTQTDITAYGGCKCVAEIVLDAIDKEVRDDD